MPSKSFHRISALPAREFLLSVCVLFTVILITLIANPVHAARRPNQAQSCNQQLTPFKGGQALKIEAPPGEGMVEIPLFSLPDSQTYFNVLHAPRDLYPLLVRFAETPTSTEIEPGYHFVRLNLPGMALPKSTFVLVNEKDLKPFGSDPNETVKILDAMTEKHIPFERDEVIRYRNNETGLVSTGKFLAYAEPKDGMARCRIAVPSPTTEKTVIELGCRLVYKMLPAASTQPLTPYYATTWLDSNAYYPQGTIKRYLNAFGVYLSDPMLQEASEFSVLMNVTMKFAQILPWDPDAIRGEAYGFSLKDLLEIRAAVCRHQAFLLAIILSEAGFKANLVASTLSDGEGHGWIEVELKDGRTFIVDPANKKVMDRAGLTIQYIDQNQPYTLFLTDPKRVTVPPKPWQK